jgi:DNA polymerase-3 subunit chi
VAKVDFYILSGSGEQARHQFACRLAEKAYKLENRVHIHVSGQETVRRIDDLLWTFRDGSFVPHEVLAAMTGTPASPESPITIGCDELPEFDCDLLINLGDSVPEQAASFPRVAEVVTSDEDCKSISRQRFVDYRNQGHTLDTHNL